MVSWSRKVSSPAARFQGLDIGVVGGSLRTLDSVEAL